MPGGADWLAVDAFIEDRLIGEDEALTAALKTNAEAGLPAIDVSPAQGKLLCLLARMIGARRILEIGTLGGYSTIWLARGAGAGGKVVTLEVDPHHAKTARANIARAGLADRVDIRIGPALKTLEAMTADNTPGFDFVFIDADKVNNANYLGHGVRLARPGAVIVCDNVVRGGRVIDANSDDAAIAGTRALYDAIARHPRLDATAIQTVGSKGWDGFALVLVGAEA